MASLGAGIFSITFYRCYVMNFLSLAAFHPVCWKYFPYGPIALVVMRILLYANFQSRPLITICFENEFPSLDWLGES